MLRNIFSSKSIAIVFFLYLTVRLAFFLLFPIYPDEIAADWWITSNLNNFPNIIIACNNSISQNLKIFNIFNNIEILQNSLFQYIRLKTLFYYLLFLGSLLYLFRKEGDSKYIYIILLTTLSPLSISFILNRPEAFIFYFSFYFIFYIESKRKYKIFLLISIYFFILSSISHPKTIYFSLIYLYGYNKGKYLLLILAALVDLFSYKYWQIRMSCSDPEILKFYSEFNINPIQLFSDFKAYFKDLYNHNFCTGPSFNSCRWSRFFNNSYFTSVSDIGVYSPSPKNYLFQNLPKLIYISAFIFATFKIFRHTLLRQRTLLLFLIPLFIHLIHNRTQNFYDIAFWLVYIFALCLYFCRIEFSKFSKVLVFIVLVASVRIDYHHFYADFLSGYHGPSLTMKFLYKEVSALKANGVDRDSLATYKIVVLDDSTYRYFNSDNKILITYYSLKNKNLLEDIQSRENIAIATRCVFFDEYKLKTLNPKILSIDGDETLCFFSKN